MAMGKGSWRAKGMMGVKMSDASEVSGPEALVSFFSSVLRCRERAALRDSPLLGFIAEIERSISDAVSGS